MRLSYQDLRYEHYRSINMANVDGTPMIDTNIDNNFNFHLGQRYQLMLAKMNNYKTVKPYTMSTANGQQSYPFPPGLVTIEGGYITVGSVNYPLQPINSRFDIEQLNAIQIQASALPQFYFVEQDSFQIWPIPQAVYSGKIYYHFRDRNLSVPDIATGIITLTNGSNIVSNSSAVFTSAMVGRWLTVTDTTAQGQGYWFRIKGFTDTTHITLGTNDGSNATWPFPTVTPASYRIGETPELPEELHICLSWGTAADYYGSMRKDEKGLAYYNNMFYTGDPMNATRDFEDKKVIGGLIGGCNLYRDRDDRTLIKRKPRLNPLQYKVWATSLS